MLNVKLVTAPKEHINYALPKTVYIKDVAKPHASSTLQLISILFLLVAKEEWPTVKIKCAQKVTKRVIQLMVLLFLQFLH